MTMLRNTLTAAFLFTASLLNAQALKVPAASPTQSWKQAFGLGEISVEYSRPLARNRVIFGDLVPFDNVWRTGANSATKITFTDDVTIEGKALKAGTYAIYTIPGKASWEVMIYKDLTMGGNVSKYNSADEIMRVTVKPETLNRMVQSFTINLDEVDAADAVLVMSWEKTLVPVHIHTEIDSRIVQNIQTVMAADSRPYFQAANYYYEHDKDMKQALAWADKAIETNKAFFTVHLKAKIQMKMKDYKGAIATAQESLKLAQAAKNDDYVRLNEKLIAEAKKGGS
jgi:hypothetical protein